MFVRLVLFAARNELRVLQEQHEDHNKANSQYSQLERRYVHNTRTLRVGAVLGWDIYAR